MIAPASRKLVPVHDDDGVLLARIAQDDLSSLGELYDRHAPAVHRIVARLLPSDADDIVHATFLRVPKLAAKFDGRPSARSWLIGIAVRTAMRHQRSLLRLGRAIARFTHIAPRHDTLSPESHAISRADVATLEAAVARLPVQQRVVFVLIEADGWTHREVAVELAIPSATVRTRLFHAKRALLRVLDQGGQP